jgi:hypothetical protein
MIFKQRGSGDMWQFLEIYDKNGFVPITPEMKDELKIVVDRLTNFEPQHMVVFDLRSNITYQTPNLSAGWMRGVIPHLLLPTNIRSSSSTNLETLPFIEGGLVYARFSDKFKYKDLAAKYETWIRNVLTMLYVEGCIVLDPILDSEFIAKWKLERWNIMNGLVLSPGHNLYKMSWNNSLVAPQKTLFLQNIYGNDGSSVNVNGRVVNCREGGYDDLERFIASVS